VTILPESFFREGATGMKIFMAAFIGAAALFALFVVSDRGSLAAVQISPAGPETLARFEIDPTRSKFMVKASRGGLLWFKGHDHHLQVKDFDGRAELLLDALEPSSLELTIRAASLEETSDVFTPQQKAIINKQLREIVLETDIYPEIKFQSRKVSGTINNGRFEVIIGGNITLHGVTRQINIPAMVNVEGDTLRAVGKFSIDRSDFNVKATSAFHGLVRVKNRLKFTFDIVAQRAPLTSAHEIEG
jgi:polyisoprenoid-binding protein YceI